MKLIDRYVLVEFLKYFFAILFTLVLIFYVAEFLRGEAETTAAKLLLYNGFQLPAILIQMTAPSAMLGTMVSLSMLNRRNELIAMQASGFSIMRIAAVIFMMVVLICCVTLFLSDRVIPPLAKKRTLYLWREIKGRKDFSLDIKSSKIWYRSKSYIYNFKTYDRTSNTIHGFGLYFFDKNFQLKQEIEAKEALYQDGLWIIKDGMMTVFPEDSQFPVNKFFTKKKLQLPDTPQDFNEIEKHVESLRITELVTFIKRNKVAGLKTQAYEVDLHSRLSLSFIPLVMSFLVVPFSVRPRRQGGLGKDVSICMGFIIFYWILFSISLSLGRSGAVEPWISVWSPSFLFLSIAMVQILKRS